MSIFRQIKAELARQGKSQKELAAFLGITPGALSQKLAGGRGISLPQLEKISTFLNIPDWELLRRSTLQVDSCDSWNGR